jgi:hypothetical protein
LPHSGWHESGVVEVSQNSVAAHAQSATQVVQSSPSPATHVPSPHSGKQVGAPVVSQYSPAAHAQSAAHVEQSSPSPATHAPSPHSGRQVGAPVVSQ